MHRLLLPLLITLIAFVATSQNAVVYQQDSEGDETTVEATTSASVVDQTQAALEYRQELDRLRNLYRLQIEAYRQSEREYIIAKDQYKNLQTLRLLEDAVAASQRVMADRNKVLITYLEITMVTLKSTEGVNLEFKNEAVASLEEQIEVLRTHGENIQKSQDREAVAAMVEEFDSIKPGIINSAYQGTSLVSIGRLQTVYDKAQIILADIQTTQKEEEVSELRKAALDRAYAETERKLDEVKELLQVINENYGKQENFSSASYSNLSSRLEPVYTGLSQTVAYLDELLEI